MHRNEITLLGTRRFLPLFVTQFFGALNDNLFKNAIAILILFRLAGEQGLDGQVLVTLATGIFILPFFLFSATAGQLSDRMEKSRLIRIIKTGEVLVMSLGVLGLYLGDSFFLMFVLFLMGVQSAFFGPVKYSILPTHLNEDELIAGNGLIGAATFLAILIGTIAGGLLILTDFGIGIVSLGVLGVAALGLSASFFIPKAGPAAPDLRINANFLSATLDIVSALKTRRTIYMTVLGISWFWLVGATFLAQFPAYAKNVLGANEEVVTLFLTTFSIGIGIGAMLCNRLLKGEVSAKYVPFGALGITLFSLDLVYASTGLPAPEQDLMGAMAFFHAPGSWRILIDLLGISITAGLYIVPLYALLQSRSDTETRSRTIAGNNIMNALFMVVGAAIASAALAYGFGVLDIFLGIAVLNGLVALYICKLLPEEVFKAIIRFVLKLFYRVEVKGLKNLTKLGDQAVVVVNHVSFLDGILIAAFLPGRLTFAIDTFIAKRWWVRPFLGAMNAQPLDPSHPLSTRTLIHLVQEGKRCVIFPEGRITVTGALMKVYDGPGMVADKAEAPIVPVRIDGAQYSQFSRLKGKVRLRWFPKITLTVLEPRTFKLPEGLIGRKRRQMAGQQLYDIMSDMIFRTCDTGQTLYEAFLDARTVHGGGAPVVEDQERVPASYDRVVLGSQILGRQLTRFTQKGENVGVMLPNTVGAAVTFFALQAHGRVPAMLNFATGLNNMRSACRAAEVKTILTARRFVEAAKLADTVQVLAQNHDVVYLEDVRENIGLLDKLIGLAARPMAGFLHKRYDVSPDDAAVVLFTSGSEGTPKGVVLSHRNLLANRYQLAARVDFNPTDVVFNALPIFHSFGLMGGMLLPMLSGIKTFLYPSPLHYRIIPALAYDRNATILFGTDTFLAGYARVAHAYDFYSLRYVFAGAEKIKDETRAVWQDKFGLRIMEGYGATETAPVMAVNTPMHYQAGTVGRLLPGLEVRLDDVPGIDDGKRLVVKGPNVMKGYLRVDNPGALESLADGWYDTGDIVSLDPNGYVSIRGRAKRFAKIAGEMVSLAAVEAAASELWPDFDHAVTSLPDPRKGEQLILVTNHPEAERMALVHHAQAKGMAEIMVPKTILTVEKVPLLGTGKIDYVAVKAMAENQP